MSLADMQLPDNQPAEQTLVSHAQAVSAAATSPAAAAAKQDLPEASAMHEEHHTSSQQFSADPPCCQEVQQCDPKESHGDEPVNMQTSAGSTEQQLQSAGVATLVPSIVTFLWQMRRTALASNIT